MALQQLNKKFVAECELNDNNLSVFACMLGNDYIGQVKGEGFVSCMKKMTEYVEYTAIKQVDWIHNNHVTKLDIENQKKFYSAFGNFLFGPVFIVVPNDATMFPCDAWIQGPNSYSVDLKSMDDIDNINKVDFWMNSDHTRRSNLRIGYFFLHVLWQGHPPPLISTYDHTFCVNVWSRTGLALRWIEPQFDNKNQELSPGSEIDFYKRPPHLLPNNILIFWLVVREISTKFTHRVQILFTVDRVRNFPVERPPLPSVLRRGSGGYSSFKFLALKGGFVEWSTIGDILTEIRKNVPVIDDELFTDIFGKQNNT